MEIIIIAAIALNNALGKDNELLWRLPDDMKFFAETTKGHTVIMGRKTYESIPKKYRPLEERHNIVISKSKNYADEGALMADNFYDALGVAESIGGGKIFIIGGASVYQRALKVADRMIITHVNYSFPDADTFFPKHALYGGWKGNIIRHKSSDDKHKHSFTIYEYLKKR